jgi:hypothetical protein
MIKSASLVKEIIVKAENKRGVLADISKMMAEHGISIEAMAGYVTPDNDANLMLVTDDERRAVDALKASGYESIYETEVVYVEAENKSGALKVISDCLADANIDIRYNYGSTSSGATYARMVLGTSDNEKAVVALENAEGE